MRIKAKFILLFATTLINTFAVAKSIPIVPKVIYGKDDRVDVFESSDSLMKELSRSTAAQILDGKLIQKGDFYTLNAPKLKDWGRICPTERFVNQYAAADCSGFLVAPDILVTAGHCVFVGCDSHSWVFDYANTNQEEATFTFQKDQVYRCEKILAQEKDDVTMSDFAVIKLDRAVKNRVPLKFRKTGKVADDANFTVIGHPSGLPLKIASGAEMRNNTNPIFFTTNTDTFGRNSGSAIFDSKTGLVEGILVRGDSDYQESEKQNDCRETVFHDQNSGAGEEVTRITHLEILKRIK